MTPLPDDTTRFDVFVSLLADLDGIAQDPLHHPEGDALFHSLQVFEQALASDPEPELLLAALLHDVGKAWGGRDHDQIGAELLAPHVSPRVGWAVAHHLDLLREPRRTRARLRGTPQLRDLERLRRWDLAGRDPRAKVREPEEAVSIVLEALAERGGHV